MTICQVPWQRGRELALSFASLNINVRGLIFQVSFGVMFTTMPREILTKEENSFAVDVS